MKFIFSRKSLKNKILSGFLLSLFLTLIVLISSYLNLRHLGKASDAILKRNYNSILASQKMIDAVDQQNNSLLRYIEDKQSQTVQNYLDHQRIFEQWMLKANENITEKGEKEILNNLSSAYTSYLVQVDKIHDISSQSVVYQLQYYNKKILPYSENVKTQCARLSKINQDAMFALSDNARTISHRAIVSLWFIGLISILLGIIFSITIANYLMKPIKSMLSATKEISEGNYDTVITYHSEDEFGHLTNQFNEMTAKLKMYNDMNIKAIMREKQKNDAIIQNIDDGIMVIDEEFKLININQKAAKVFQIDSSNSLNKHFLEIINNQYLFNLFKTTFETGKIPDFTNDDNILALELNGKKKYYQFLINPVLKDKDQWYGLLFLLRDVTKLKEIDQLKSEFVMIVSHELKTPLTSIAMSVDLLLEKPAIHSNQEEYELLSIAHEEVVRLKALISDILDLSKMESGKIELDFQSVSIQTLFENASHIFNRQTEEKNVQFL
ncbi:MAG TPA: histidine kinase dimerization/phospho-acceptor domain-containing protein, partial [Candidatus Cloacimonadota bacterium]|nr:histidine kinase dimerization/phospho-acceptor domain-containing protein [Candidatus Cloacimonadota bacterium]